MTIAPVVPAVVTPDGQLRFTPEARRSLDAWCLTLKGKPVQVVVKRQHDQRSLQANAWAWGIAYPIIAEALGYDTHEHEDLHYALVAKCFGEHFDKRLGAMVPNKRSSKLPTTDFSHYMEWLVRYAATDLGGIVVPLPGESETA